MTTSSSWINTIQQMDPVIQLSFYKLYQQENILDKGPSLRKQVLIRNLLNSNNNSNQHDYDMDINNYHEGEEKIIIQDDEEYEKQQKEQNWLDACFDQLNEEEDDIMEESFIPPPPPPPPLPPSLSPTSLHTTSTSTNHTLSPSSSTSIPHNVVLAIPSNNQDKFLALLDWSWSTSPTTTL
ncbi:unnamed protein product [Cunninghamella echinulata]